MQPRSSGIVGIVMASIGINFYNKCKTNKELSRSAKNLLVGLLVGFIFLVVGTGLLAAYQDKDAPEKLCNI